MDYNETCYNIFQDKMSSKRIYETKIINNWMKNNKKIIQTPRRIEKVHEELNDELSNLIRQRNIINYINPLNPELNPICYLLALLWAHHFLHVSRLRVKSLTLRQLMSYIYIYIYIYIYGAPILDVSRSHTTTHHSR